VAGISSAALQIPLRESRVGAQRLFFARGRAGRAMNRQVSMATAQAAEEIAPLMGNEAIARGAWEAGVRVAAAYPGTPSTEILETLARFPADEVYAVQGFDLEAPDQTLNMQRDLTAYAGARIAFGNRLALASGPLTLWYSFYWNQMRFGRLLIMQAVDLALWRPALPVLDRVAMGAGFVRAHISATGRSPAATARPFSPAPRNGRSSRCATTTCSWPTWRKR